MPMSFEIRAEVTDDFTDVARLQSAAFDGDVAIPSLINDLRRLDGAFPTLSLLAASEVGQAIGHVMLSHAWVDAPKRMIDVMVLSPLGVHPTYHGIGIGTALIEAALEQANKLGVPMVFLEGNPRYYGQRGFGKAMNFGFRRPSLRMPEGAFQVARLATYSDDMTGTFVYRDVHWRHGVGLYR